MNIFAYTRSAFEAVRPHEVAHAIPKALTGEHAEFFGGRYRPNMRVYRKLLEADERALP